MTYHRPLLSSTARAPGIPPDAAHGSLPQPSQQKDAFSLLSSFYDSNNGRISGEASLVVPYSRKLISGSRYETTLMQDIPFNAEG